MIPWPSHLRPLSMSLFIETLTGRFDPRYTAHSQVFTRRIGDEAGKRLAQIAGVEGIDRAHDRWVAQIDLDLGHRDAGEMDGFLARLRGPAQAALVPAWMFNVEPAGSLLSFSDYAAETGPSDWDDDTGFDDGTVFSEGTGTPTLLGGRGHRMSLSGFAPNETDVLAITDMIGAGGERAHVVTAVGTTDHNGYLAIWIAPTARDPVPREPLVTSEVSIKMRLSSDNAGRGRTRPPVRTQYQIDLVEVLP